MRKFLLGAAAGLTVGYAVYRAYESLAAFSPPGKKREADAAAYGATRRALMISGIARSIAAATAVAYGPSGETMERSVRRLPVWLQPMAFAAEAMLLESILDLPIDYVEGYALERRYDLSDQSLASWFSDTIKQEAIGSIVTIALTGIFATALRRWPSSWPFFASAGVFPLLLLANIVVPIYIMPLFNEYRPIEGALEKRLRALASRYGVGDAEILRVDMSKQTKKANAFVTGIGNTHRIVVGDTLIEHFPVDEIEFVVAHELGHYVSKDSWRLIGVGQVLAMTVLFGSFFALGQRGRSEPVKPVTLARIQWWSVLFSQLLRPAMSAFARSREWAADRFALDATHAPETGAAAFRRLRDQNLAEDEQPAWFEFVFSTHPSLKARIEALEFSTSSR
jgi:STE24 endopeptidase